MTTKSKMSLTYLIALCLGLFVSVTAQSLWKDSYEVNEDRERLKNGDNLIYAIAGTESFLTSSVDQILTTFQSSSAREMTKNISAALQVVDLQCMDLASSSNPLKQFQDFIREKKYKSNSGSISSSTSTDTELPYQWTEIFVVYNLDTLLTSSDLKKLDFLFRITDKSFEFANVAVVLLWDLDQRTLPSSSSSGESLKDRLANVWKVGAPLVNGDALAGRIARTVIERAAMVSTLLGSSAKTSEEDWSDMPGASLSLHCLTARTHALTASATAIFNHKTQRAKALFETTTALKAKTNKPTSPPALSSLGSLPPISASLSNMTNWLSSIYQNATTPTTKSNINNTKLPTPSLWQSLFFQPSLGPKTTKPTPSPANRPSLSSYFTRLGTWILTPIRSILSLLSKGFNHMHQYIQQTLGSIGRMLSKIPRNVVSLLSWIMSGPRKVVSGVLWLWDMGMSRMGQFVQMVYRSVGMKEMYALFLSVPGQAMKGVKAMQAHVRLHGYLPLLLSLLFAALPGFMVAYGMYSDTMQRCFNDLLHELHVLVTGSSPIISEGGTRGRSTSTSAQSRHRSSSQNRQTSPSPSPPKKHITLVEENHSSTSASTSASTSSSSRRKSTTGTASSTVKENKTPKADRHSMLPSVSTTGMKNDRKSLSKSHGKSTKTQAEEEEEEEEEEERLRIAAECDVYKGTRSKTPMKRK